MACTAVSMVPLPVMTMAPIPGSIFLRRCNQCDAVHLRHREVGEQQIVFAGAERRQCRGRRVVARGHVAGGFQRVAERTHLRVLVIHHQQAGRQYLRCSSCCILPRECPAGVRVAAHNHSAVRERHVPGAGWRRVRSCPCTRSTCYGHMAHCVGIRVDAAIATCCERRKIMSDEQPTGDSHSLRRGSAGRCRPCAAPDKRAGIECVWRRVETESALTRCTAGIRAGPGPVRFLTAPVRWHGGTEGRAADSPRRFPFCSCPEPSAKNVRSRRCVPVRPTMYSRKTWRVSRPPSGVPCRKPRRLPRRIRQEAQIARLNRVLRMQSGISGLVLRIRDRTELMRETCRLAVSVGGYAVAIASARVPGFATLQPTAWSGINDEMTEGLRAYLAESVSRESSVIGRVVRTGKEFVCNNTSNLAATATFDALMLHSGSAVGGGAATGGGRQCHRAAGADRARLRCGGRRRARHVARGCREPVVRIAVPAAGYHGPFPVAFRSADRTRQAATVLRARAATDQRLQRQGRSTMPWWSWMSSG